ncbi:hypothetical protein GJAV_G00210310 [Gymnothorax javanicus]|nr:hypothetical protein GJAV_G00210310 [Gymnothorax javanicus]
MGKTTAIIINKLLLMSFLSSQISAEDVVLYGLVDGEVMLIPEPFSEKLDRILWKHGEDKAAEWEPDALEYFRIFKGAASLNETSGTLALRNLNSKFNGFYSAEINGKPSTKRSNLIVISPVSKPSIEKRCNESVCTLSCKTTPTIEDHYTWMEDGKDIGNHDSDLKLVKSDKVLDKAYKCNYSNPLSYALSDHIVPFSSDGGPDIGAIVGVTVGGAALIPIAVFATKYVKGRRKRRLKITKERTSENPRGNPEAGANGAAAVPMLNTGDITGSKENAS